MLARRGAAKSARPSALVRRVLPRSEADIRGRACKALPALWAESGEIRNALNLLRRHHPRPNATAPDPLRRYGPARAGSRRRQLHRCAEARERRLRNPDEAACRPVEVEGDEERREPVRRRSRPAHAAAEDREVEARVARARRQPRSPPRPARDGHAVVQGWHADRLQVDHRGSGCRRTGAVRSRWAPTSACPASRQSSPLQAVAVRDRVRRALLDIGTDCERRMLVSV